MDLNKKASAKHFQNWSATWLDDLANDWNADYKASVNSRETRRKTWIMDSAWRYQLTLLGKLPEELLMQIADHVKTNNMLDALALAQVCQQLHTIVMDIIYRYPDLDGDRIRGFYETLCNRASLGKLVKSLDLDLVREESIQHLGPAMASYTMPIETTIAPLLHRLTPNLQHLALSFWRWSNRTNHEYMPSPLPYYLGDRFDIEKDSLFALPGFQKLRTLSFEGSEFHWVLCHPPRLERLELNRDCYERADDRPLEVSKLTHLSLRCWSSILVSADLNYRPLRGFLAHFPFLKTVQIKVDDYDYDNGCPPPTLCLSPVSQGNYARIFDLFKAYSSSLEDLILDLDWPPPEFLDFVLPAGSLSHIQKLRKLSIPYEALVDARIDIFKTLPESIEILEVWYPSTSIYAVFDQLLALRRQLWFCSMRSITLQCHDSRGASYETFVYRRTDAPGN